ncbi:MULTISPECIES: hypothetical protein [unclassified Caulobacter]|uniref:hypothetical protein n=1 Tax=unclassified Caulobacter TaxID=2648921 RepID=UPI0006FEA38A|nr:MULTISPECIES: hypothetical protein [unclassified Caulobacter]KQV58223.1 hypothetical protein ASC62_05305 [Caulobacter sp. Root342]KQV69272.1 hypothetical protein ASC70_10730 [Caulobacter sp. Root343]
MILFAVFALAVAATPQETSQTNEVAPAIIQPRKGRGGVVPSDLEIERQLDLMLKDQPEKVICVRLVREGSRLPHEACKTLRGWYDFETGRGKEGQVRDVIAALKHNPRGGDEVGARVRAAPYELIEMIKDRYRSPAARAQAAQRAKTRLAPARSPADPLTSNP